MMQHNSGRGWRGAWSGPVRRGFSLMDMIVAVAVLGILMSIALPRFQRATEQCHADLAAANLRAIWCAQRLYWLDNRAFSSNLTSLQSLLDPALASATTPYTYAIELDDANTFTATATRKGSAVWLGQIAIDQSGTLSGSITAVGQKAIVPGFR
jgi:prepilin-type N-terminal cleavage/methylation domain-containing protein